MPNKTEVSSQVATTRAERTARRRRQILEAASIVIQQYGYSRASLADIASLVGISAPSLLHHFNSKDELLVALLDYRDDVSRSATSTSFEETGESRLAHLVETSEANSENLVLTQLYSVLLGESLTEDHPAKDFFISRFKGLRPKVAEGVAEAIGDPSVPEQDIEEVAAGIIAVMDGLQYQFLLDNSSVDMAAVTERVIRALLADLRARTTSISD